MESAHLPHAVLLVLVGEKPKPKKKRSGSAVGASSRPRMDRARRQAGGGMPVEAAMVGPRGVPLPVQRGPGLPQAPVMSPADVQRMRLLALQRARGGV
jgi:hypothetical protein